MKRNYYEKEFKMQIVNLITNTNKTYKEVAEEYDISISNINRWVSQYKKNKSFKLEDNLSEHEKELRKAKKEIEQLKMENDILKQAALIIGKK